MKSQKDRKDANVETLNWEKNEFDAKWRKKNLDCEREKKITISKIFLTILFQTVDGSNDLNMDDFNAFCTVFNINDMTRNGLLQLSAAERF